MAELAQLPRNLTEHVVEVLREFVLTGRLVPGQRLNEVEVAAEIGISRGPVREAIKFLVSEGLLVPVLNRGAHVILPDRPFVVALFELRTGLESMAARLAAHKRTAADVARLREVCSRARSSFAAGERFPYELNLEFHGVLLEAARSPLIAERARLAQQQLIVSRNRPDGPPGLAMRSAEASFDDHDGLVEALAAADESAAAALMEQHLDRVRDELLAELFDERARPAAR